MKLGFNSLQRDLLKRHIGPFIFCFVTIMFLLLMQFLIQFIEHLVGKDIPFLVILELIATNLAYMVTLATPMAVLAASLMAYGRFAENHELTAVKAAGVHPLKIIKPVFIVAVALTGFLAWFSDSVLPDANYKARALFLDIRMKQPGFDLQEGTFYDGIDGYTFLVENIDQQSDSLYNVTLFQESKDNRERAVIKASKGHLQTDEQLMMIRLHLMDGNIIRYLRENRREATLMEVSSFTDYHIRFDMSDLAFSRTNPDQRRRDGRTMSSREMMAQVDTIRKNIEEEQQKHFQNSNIKLFTDDTLSIHDELVTVAYNNPERTGTSSGPPGGDQEPFEAQESKFHALNMLGTLNEQRNIGERANSGLRSTRSQIDNLHSNIKWRTENVASFLVEIHKKVSIPVACIIFLLIGAPLGMLTQKGNIGINALISTLLFTFYWISIIQGEKLAERLFISPFIGMWFANIVLLIVGLYLILKISREYDIFRLGSK